MTPTPASLQPVVAVLGCGWLGLPLASALVAEGYAVVGSTTTPGQLLTLRDTGITPFLLRLSAAGLSATDHDTLQALLAGVSVLVLNVPPSRRGATGAYPALLQPVCEAVRSCGVQHVLFVSSSGVYPDEPRLMTEADALASADASSDLLRAESLFASGELAPRTTVLRLGGLIGPKRHPGRFLSGKQQVPNGADPVNLIHLDDCIGLISCIIRQHEWGRTFNACAAQHPTRQEFYTHAAQNLGLAPPQFAPADHRNGKQVDSSLVRQTTGYTFLYDDLNEALQHC